MGLLPPSDGYITWGETKLYNGSNGIGRIRGKEIGIVFQNYNLIPHLTAWENIILPAVIGNEPKLKWSLRANELLAGFKAMGVWSEGLENKKARFLSGGEQEMTAILRALVRQPAFLVADEMLKSLDRERKYLIWGFVKNLCDRENIGLLMVTHDTELARDEIFDQRFEMRYGELLPVVS